MIIKTKKQLNKIYLLISFNRFCNDNEHLIFYSLEIETPYRTYKDFIEGFTEGIDILEYILLNSPSHDLLNYVQKNKKEIEVKIEIEGRENTFHYFVELYVERKNLDNLLLELGFVNKE